MFKRKDIRSQKLLRACENGNYEKVLKLLKGGADSSYQQQKEGTWGEFYETSALNCLLSKLESTSYKRLKPDLSQQEVESDFQSCMLILSALLEAGASLSTVESDYTWKGTGETKTAFHRLVSIASATDDEKLLNLGLRFAGGQVKNTASTRSFHSMRTDGNSCAFPLHTVCQHANIRCLSILLEVRSLIQCS